MTEEQKRELQRQLWAIANTLRGKMDADDFRDYILGFVFYKYLSERMRLYADDELLDNDDPLYEQINEQTKEGAAILEAVKTESLDTLGYFLKPSELFSTIVSKSKCIVDAEDEETEDDDIAQDVFILGDLDKVLQSIQDSTMGKESEEDFIHLFEDVDLQSSKLGRSEKDKNILVSKVLQHLDKIDFQLEHLESDVLGDAYEYLIGKFASGAGKKAGEFYTPPQVSKVLAKIVTHGKDRIQSVYDPTCGSGSLLLRVSKEARVEKYYGQELNRTTYNLARMNMILHGVHHTDFEIKQADTLEKPQHMGMHFEAIVANPPFSAHWKASVTMESDDRFHAYGKLAPKTKADFAFVQHMLHHLDENGVMAVILPHGVLFRGASEGIIRRYLIEERNVLDAVIGLPANIFYGTSIPTCVLVLKQCREQPDNVLFVDASNHFEKAKNQNYLHDEDVMRIVEAYAERKDIEKYAYVASLDEIVENDYNLNIPRYVDTFEPEPPVDIAAVCKQLAQLEKDMAKNDAVIRSFCDELDIAAPC